MDFLSYFIISVLCGAGMGIVIVEKRYEFPVKYLNVMGRYFLHNILKYPHRVKMKKVFHCAICLSFWTTFVSDLFLFVASGYHYFLWPLSGFATAGIVWFIFSLLSVIENRTKQ